jgi:hypothetical protein
MNIVWRMPYVNSGELDPGIPGDVDPALEESSVQ